MIKKRTLAGILAVLTAFSLSACGGGGSNSYSAKSAAVSEEADYSSDYYSDDIYEAAEAPMESENGADAVEEVSVADSRKIIKTVNLDVETEEFDSFVKNIEAKVNNLGGYIEHSNIGGTSINAKSQNRRANITIRVPAKRLDDLVTNIEAKSNVTNKSLSAEDITLSYSDTKEHLNTLKVEQQRLEQLMLQADDIETIIAIEKRLTDIRYEIESYGSRLKTYDNQVDYSTVYLEVSEVIEYTEPEPVELTFGQRIARGLAESFHDLGEDLADFIVGLIVSLPYIVVFLMFTTIFVFILVKFIQFIIWICSSKEKREERKQKKLEKKNNKARKQAPAAKRPGPGAKKVENKTAEKTEVAEVAEIKENNTDGTV